MISEIHLEVYRRLDNRAEGFSDESPRALELHVRRGRALHEVLEGHPNWTVLNWGNTDDTKSHESVDLQLVLTGLKVVASAAIPAIVFLGGVLAKSAVDSTISECVKTLIEKLRRKQKDKQIQEFTVVLADGTNICCVPPNEGELIICFADRKVTSIRYDASSEEASEREGPPKEPIT